MIRVFPHKTNATPCDEKVYFTGPPLEPLEDREVYVSCLFTYHKTRAQSLAELWDRQGYNVKIGGPAFNDYGGEFVPGRFVKPGFVITSRGCNNRCWFCYTWKREGNIRELPIVDGFNVLDSNLLQCSESHIRKVFAMLKRQKQKPLFTGGLEARILQNWHVSLLREVKAQRVYFAYDTADDYEPLVEACRKMFNGGFTASSHIVHCYVLIGYPKDTFDAAENRLQQVLDLGLVPMAMLYRGNDGIEPSDWQPFARKWNRKEIIFSKPKPERTLFA